VDYQGDGVWGAEDRPEFRRNESCPLDEEVIIVDECSMLDTSLTASLLRAMRRGSRLILIGDSDQLPSVGPGNVLHDVISSGALPVISLEKVWRQAEMSLIVSNAHLINKGRMPVIDARDRDFFFIRCDSDAQISATVCDLCNRRLPAAYPDEQVQVISPSKRGDAGADRLNSALRDLINPAARDKPELIRETGSFRKGDKVMQIRNNYGLEWTCGRSSGTGVFNGDIGFITDADPVEGSVSVDFDGRRASYTKTDLTDLDQAYAITVHKSQGSEYPTVVIPLGNVPPFLRTRNLIYTAVTRAINRVIIVGRQDVLAEMVATPDSGVRMTGLSQMLAASGRKN
ncbi:MAG: AAA family ATPase, partial [Clostridia bacterium]|nr:AAA family ATPase [Clostridia bacterium]